MVMVDWEIKSYISDGLVSISPYDESLVNPNSIDLRLSDGFITFGPTFHAIDPYNQQDISNCGKPFATPDITIDPGDFILGSSIEKITLPDNICAEVTGKSSLARLGIDVHKTAGWIDAGFSGTITFEISNCGMYPIKLKSGMTFAQLIFHKTEHCKIPYGNKPGSKYQGQQGPTKSRYYRNKL